MCMEIRILLFKRIQLIDAEEILLMAHAEKEMHRSRIAFGEGIWNHRGKRRQSRTSRDEDKVLRILCMKRKDTKRTLNADGIPRSEHLLYPSRRAAAFFVHNDKGKFLILRWRRSN